MRINAQERALALASRPAAQDQRSQVRLSETRTNDTEAVRSAQAASGGTRSNQAQVVQPNRDVSAQDAPRTARQKERAEVRVVERRAAREEAADNKMIERERNEVRSNRETGRRINIVA